MKNQKCNYSETKQKNKAVKESLSVACFLGNGKVKADVVKISPYLSPHLPTNPKIPCPGLPFKVFLKF